MNIPGGSGITWRLDGEIGRDKCDHDVCICGWTRQGRDGFWRTTVPHSGVWIVVDDPVTRNG